MRQALAKAGSLSEIIVYPFAHHHDQAPQCKLDNSESAKPAWEHMLAFLKQHLH